MAKLSAYGRKEIWRMSKSFINQDGNLVTDTYALMSDGAILSKFKVQHLDGSVNSGTWKVVKKIDIAKSGKIESQLDNQGYTYSH